MRRRLLLVLFSVLFGVSVGAEGLYRNEPSFVVGETAKYNIYYNLGFIWIHAGDVVFSVKETPTKEYLLEVAGYTLRSFDKFYCIRDTFSVTMTKDALKPVDYKEVKHEDTYFCDKRYHFDWSGARPSVHLDFNKRGRKTKDTTMVITNDVLDLISTCYLFRRLDISKVKKNQVISFRMLFDDVIYNLGLSYKGAENIKLRNKTRYNALKFMPKLITGDLFEKENDMTIYVSNDDNHVPLYIEAKIKVGAVKVMLESVKNTKYPMASEIKK